MSDKKPTNIYSMVQDNKKVFSEKLRDRNLDFSQLGMQASVYLLIMNAAVLFGVLTLLKDYSGKTIAIGIGRNLVVFIFSSILAIFSYKLFVLLRLVSYRYEGELDFNLKTRNYFLAPILFSFISSGLFMFGIMLLSKRLLDL